MWSRGPREVYVNGSGGDEEDCSPFERCAHWDSKHWTTTESACERASGLAYGWTVGDPEGRLGLLHRGGQQTQMIRPHADSAVAALWPRSRRVVYVLGNQRDLPNSEMQSLLLLWDGNRWLPRIPIADVRLQALWGSGDELWAVGSKGAIWHVAGLKWEEQESGNSSDLYAFIESAIIAQVMPLPTTWTSRYIETKTARWRLAELGAASARRLMHRDW